MTSRQRNAIEKFNLIVGILVTFDISVSLAGFVAGSGSPLLQTFTLSGVVLGVLVLLVLNRLRRLLHVSSHVHDVFATFSIQDNTKAWDRVVSQYRYLGVSGHTMLMAFRSYLQDGGFDTPCTLRFLLMMPDSQCVIESKRHELGSGASEEDVKREAEATSRQIEQCAKFYMSVTAGVRKVEVRFYRQYAGYWAHLIDESEAFVSYMFKGETGLSSMVIHLKRGTQEDSDNLLRRFFADDFERIWAGAEPAVDYFANRAAAKSEGAPDREGTS